MLFMIYLNCLQYFAKMFVTMMSFSVYGQIIAFKTNRNVSESHLTTSLDTANY